MSPLAVSPIPPNGLYPKPIGTVIERPTGEVAFLWQAYARTLDRLEQQQKEIRKLRKQQNQK